MINLTLGNKSKTNPQHKKSLNQKSPEVEQQGNLWKVGTRNPCIEVCTVKTYVHFYVQKKVGRLQAEYKHSAKFNEQQQRQRQGKDKGRSGAESSGNSDSDGL